MSAIAMLPPSLSKEVRALAMPWLACVTCILVMDVSDAPYLFGPLATIAYLVGTVALGALSIGHEYTGRTLSLLLTLPARRERLFATKLAVLTVMLLALWAIADALLFRRMPAPAAEKQMVQLIPLMCALFLAPWLTMASRSSIAGTVFALTIPGVLMVTGEVIGVAKYGYGSVTDAFRLTFASFGTLALCALGAVMSWRMFTRLEAIEGPHQDVRLPRWLKAGSAAGAHAQLTRHNPVWLLVKKELRLQQLPLALTALYIFEWIAIVSLGRVSELTYDYDHLFSGLTFLHVGLLPILIGSFASAGERHIDTLQSQLLLPMAASKQWAVKVGVVFAAAITLGIGLPALLLSVRPGGVNAIPLTESETPILGVVLLASGSLYISSLCRSGLWALLMSLPAVVGSALFLQLSFEWVGFPVYFAVRQLIGNPLPRLLPMYFLPPRAMSYLLVAGLIAAIALRFAFINHRSADRPATRVWTQVILMAAFVTAGIAAGAAWQALRQ